MRLHSFQHVPCEGLGSIANWLAARQHPLSVTRFYQHDPLPELDAIDGLIVMGVYDDDRFPWLEDEKHFIADALHHGKWVLGICLGSQLVAGCWARVCMPIATKRSAGGVPLARRHLRFADGRSASCAK